MKWYFEPIPAMGGASGEAYGNTLNAHGPQGHMIAREAIQNSVDAHDQHSGGTVHVRFTRYLLSREDVSSLGQTLQLHEEHVRRRREVGLHSSNLLQSFEEGSGGTTNLLIEDFHTLGLGGPLAYPSPSAHFRKLLLELGLGDKADIETTSGGSYGFGKSVYSGSSDIRTIVAYSVFAPTYDTEHESARFMACTYFPGHHYENCYYTGRAWLGRKDPDTEMIVPATGPEAHRFAQSIGIPPRSDDQLGTSILILGCDVRCADLRDGVEKYWWPRLHDGNLEVSLYEDSEEVDPPRPKRRVEIRPFMDAYDVVLNRSDPDEERQEHHTFNRYNDYKLGSYVFSALNDVDMDDPDLDSDYVNSVALIRGPRMIVDYWKIGIAGREPCCGVFVSDPEIERILKLAEPSTHDEWDPDSRRLEKSESDIVEKTLDRIKKYFRQFQRNVTPEVPREAGQLPELQRLLGRFFRKSSPAPVSPPTTDDPVSIHIEHMERIEKRGKVRISGKVRIGLRPDSEKNAERVRVQVNLALLIDDTRRVDETLRMTLSGGTGCLEELIDEDRIAILSLEKQTSAELSVIGPAIDPLASCQLGVDVRQEPSN